MFMELQLHAGCARKGPSTVVFAGSAKRRLRIESMDWTAEILINATTVTDQQYISKVTVMLAMDVCSTLKVHCCKQD
jgi:hypothetical protein